MTKTINLDDVMPMITALLPQLDLCELAEVYAWVKACAAYRDDSCPSRTCDQCDNAYRGPAVFCSLRCAKAAA